MLNVLECMRSDINHQIEYIAAQQEHVITDVNSFGEMLQQNVDKYKKTLDRLQVSMNRRAWRYAVIMGWTTAGYDEWLALEQALKT